MPKSAYVRSHFLKLTVFLTMGMDSKSACKRAHFLHFFFFSTMGMNSTANTIQKLHQSISIRNKSVNMRIIYADYALGMRACDIF